MGGKLFWDFDFYPRLSNKTCNNVKFEWENAEFLQKLTCYYLNPKIICLVVVAFKKKPLSLLVP